MAAALVNGSSFRQSTPAGDASGCPQTGSAGSRCPQGLRPTLVLR